MMEKIRSVLQFDIVFFGFAFYLISKGLLRREDSFLTAETGLGYMLGIVGGTMMLLLLLYPLRKHVRLFNALGPVRYWFRFHMLLGVAGPVLILYHSNFSLGSTNSNIALFSMLVVAGSGLFGRFFYSKIHDGLYGRKIKLAELQGLLQDVKQDIRNSQLISEMTDKFEQRFLKQSSLFIAVINIPLSRIFSFNARRIILKSLLHPGNAKSSNGEKFVFNLDKYFQAVIRVADYSVYERLFSLWHVLHIPLFIMMIVSGIVHVVAVHIY